MGISIHDLSKTVLALRLVFWGGLITVLDFKINGFDLLHDLIGMILITFGVFILASVPVHQRYRRVMVFVLVMTVLSVLNTIRVSAGIELPSGAGMVLSIYNIVALGAICAFCLAMLWLCVEARLPRAMESWRLTTFLFVGIYFVPMGLFYAIGFLFQMQGKEFHFNINNACGVFVLLGIFAVPLIHLFISTSRMRREIAASTYTGVDSEM